jgi:hypothetical protein
MLSILCLFMYGLNGQTITHSNQMPSVTEPVASNFPVLPDVHIVPSVLPDATVVPVVPDAPVVPIVPDVPVVVLPDATVVSNVPTAASSFVPQMSNLPPAPRLQEFQTSITPSPTIPPTQQRGTSSVTVNPILIFVIAGFVASCVVVVLLFACKPKTPKKRLQPLYSSKLTEKNVSSYF